ncbi:MAG: YdcF family protein, partial [Candidatus Rokuibacteriota bacterium]
RRALVLLLALGLVAGLGLWGVGGLGHWLVVADPLEPAGAIVVLSGHLPFRAIEAARIYQQGWAPAVWVTRPANRDEEAALGRLGVRIVREEAYSREVLQRLGVPTKATRVLNDEVQNTVQEVRLIARELERLGSDRVILVTSKPHSRRVGATWRALVGVSPRAIVRYATEDPYNPTRWWRQTADALAVSREVFGLMNVWAGFPVQPDRQRR